MKNSQKRDSQDRIKEALHKLKSENNKLRKENAQLRKQLNKSLKYVSEVYSEEPLEAIILPKEEKCPKCKSQKIKELLLGKVKLKICSSCGYKKRVP